MNNFQLTSFPFSYFQINICLFKTSAYFQPFNDENFGTFKFVTEEPKVNITTSADVTTLPLLLAKPQISDS